LICGLGCCECIQERYWRISGQLSSADLRRSAAALEAETSPSSQLETGDGAESSQDDVAMDTANDVTMDTADDVDNEMTPLRRHDSLKAKKRSLLAALAQKRLESANDTADNKRFVFCLQ